VNEEDDGFNITSLLSDLPMDIGSFGNTNFDKYLALLESRRVRDVLIEEFDLWEEYNEEYIEHVYKALAKNIEITDNFDGTITISTYFESYPEKAAQMAQRMYDELYDVSLELRKEKSRTYREFLEGSLAETYATLGQLEDSLKVFQIENRILKFDEQAEFSFKALAELEAQNLIYKVEYDYLKNALAENSPELKEVESRLEAIKKTKQNLYKNGEEYVMAFDEMPILGLTYYRLFRDITIQQEILKFLLPVVHNARIEEKKETVNIQVIDTPFIPQYKAKPKRLTYIIVLTMLVGIFELLFFAVLDAYRKNKQEIHNWVLQDDK
jgi:capsule polysaccharide export protein KpsE/RkpR